MALSSKSRKRFEASMARRTEADEILNAIDASTAKVAADIAAIGALSGVPADLAHAAAKTDLDTVQAKVDAILAALKAAGLMS